MSNTAVKVVAGLVIVGALGLGAPYAIGKQVETDFRAGIAAAPDHYPYPIKLLSYKRGVFSAVAETQQVFDLGPDPNEITVDDNDEPVIPPNRQVPVTLRHVISHGPRLDGLRLARIVNTIQFEGEWLAAVRRVFGEAEPVTLTIDRGWGGDLSGELVSPAVDTTLPADGEDTGRHIQWSGLTSQFTLRGQHVVGTLAAPGMKIDDDALAIGPIAMTADLTVVDDGIWLGTFGSSFASVSANGAAGAASMTGMSLDADTTDTAGKLKSGTTFTIKDMLFNEVRVSDTRIRVVLDQLGTKAMSSLSRELNRYTAAQSTAAPADQAADPEAELKKMLAAVRPALAAAAADQPVFALEELSFTAPQGKFQATGRVQYVGDANLDDFAVGTDLAAAGKVDAPMALVDLLLQWQASTTVVLGSDGEPVTLSPEQLAAATKTSRDGMVSQGLISVDGDRARSEIEFKSGVLTVNGKALGGPPPT